MEINMQITITNTKNPVSMIGFLGTNCVETIFCTVSEFDGICLNPKRRLSTGTVDSDSF